MKRILMSVVLAMVLVGTSAAQAFSLPFRTVTEAASLVCPVLSSEQGTATLGVGYTEDSWIAWSTVWRPAATPSEDQPWLEGFAENPLLEGTELAVTIPLYDYETGGAEEGVVAAVLTAAGEPTTVSHRHRDGNSWWEESVTTAPATVTGTYTIAGVGTFDLSACVGQLVRAEYLATEPAAYVRSSAFVEMSCRIDSSDEDIAVSAWMSTRRGHGEGELSVVVFPYVGGEDSVYFGTGAATITRKSITGTAPMTDYAEAPLGNATISALLSLVDVERVRTSEYGPTETARIETLDVAGTLTLPDGRTHDLDSCSATRIAGQVRIAPDVGHRG